MADPVRVIRMVNGDWIAHPDDLARAIREGVRAELREVTQALFNDGQYSLGLSFQHALAAPREPAQERQEAPTPPDARAAGFAEGVEAAAKLIGETPLGYFGGHPSDRRSEIRAGMVEKIRALTPPTPTPTPTPDPLLPGLLPGLRAARYLLQEWRDQGATSSELYQKITAEIARREGGR